VRPLCLFATAATCLAVSHKLGLDELRGVVGNLIAIRAYRSGAPPFTDRAIVAKIAWKHVPLVRAPFAGAFGSGMATTVQFISATLDLRPVSSGYREGTRYSLRPLRGDRGLQGFAGSKSYRCKPLSPPRRYAPGGTPTSS
jgi:hypothetical protein